MVPIGTNSICTLAFKSYTSLKCVGTCIECLLNLVTTGKLHCLQTTLVINMQWYILVYSRVVNYMKSIFCEIQHHHLMLSYDNFSNMFIWHVVAYIYNYGNITSFPVEWSPAESMHCTMSFWHSRKGTA